MSPNFRAYYYNKLLTKKNLNRINRTKEWIQISRRRNLKKKKKLIKIKNKNSRDDFFILEKSHIIGKLIGKIETINIIMNNLENIANIDF
jgi:hypothetical protein